MEFIVQDCVKLTDLQRLLFKEALAKNLEISLESYIIDIEDKQVRVTIKEKSGEASHG
jgi:hypothetical protein